jgi:hypothetical protein
MALLRSDYIHETYTENWCEECGVAVSIPRYILPRTDGGVGWVEITICPFCGRALEVGVVSDDGGFESAEARGS